MRQIDQTDRADPQSLAYAVHAAEGQALEAEAVRLIKQYGFFLPAPAKEFFRKLANFLNWQQLKKEL